MGDKKPRSKGASATTLAVCVLVCAVLVGVAYSGTVASITGPRHANKPYKTFEEFYPFYLSEHSDSTCRLLHIIGTSISSLLVLSHPRSIVAFLSAAAVGHILSPAIAGLPNGAIEGAVVISVWLGMNRLLHRNYMLAVLLVGYGFAWVGHFGFEKNKPATFLYPTYSLMGDYTMLYHFATGAIGLTGGVTI